VIRTCHIHIGMPKSGSTSIQRSFSGLDEDRIAYLRLSDINHSYDLQKMFCSTYPTHPDAKPLHAVPAARAREREGLLGLSEGQIARDRRDCVVSGEIMYILFDEADIGRLTAFLAPHFDRLRVIAYIREPLGYMRSLMQQLPQTGIPVFDPAGVYPNYRKSLEPWITALGRQNVELVPFERQTLIGGDVVSDFSMRLGLGKPITATKAENISLTAEAYAMVYAMQREIKVDKISGMRLAITKEKIRRVRGYGVRSLDLDPEACGAILRSQAADIDWLVGQIGRPLAPSGRPGNAVLFGSEADVLALAEEVRPDFDRWVAPRVKWESVAGNYIRRALGIRR
jgi:hypothetical protein